jgi:hypothetical protein
MIVMRFSAAAGRGGWGVARGGGAVTTQLVAAGMVLFTWWVGVGWGAQYLGGPRAVAGRLGD